MDKCDKRRGYKNYICFGMRVTIYDKFAIFTSNIHLDFEYMSGGSSKELFQSKISPNQETRRDLEIPILCKIEIFVWSIINQNHKAYSILLCSVSFYWQGVFL